MAHIVFNADGTLRAGYKDLGPDSLSLVEADAAARGLSVQEVPMDELTAIMDKARAVQIKAALQEDFPQEDFPTYGEENRK